MTDIEKAISILESFIAQLKPEITCFKEDNILYVKNYNLNFFIEGLARNRCCDSKQDLEVKYYINVIDFTCSDKDSTSYIDQSKSESKIIVKNIINKKVYSKSHHKTGRIKHDSNNFGDIIKKNIPPIGEKTYYILNLGSNKNLVDLLCSSDEKQITRCAIEESKRCAIRESEKWTDNVKKQCKEQQISP